MNYTEQITDFEVFVHGQDQLYDDVHGYDVQYATDLGYLVAQSEVEDVERFTVDEVESRMLSVSLVGWEFAGRSSKNKYFAAHAGIKGLRIIGCHRYAEVGSVLVDKDFRGRKLGLEVVQALVERASEPDMAQQYGYEGLMAIANQVCQPIMLKAGLEVVQPIGRKQLMTMKLWEA